MTSYPAYRPAETIKVLSIANEMLCAGHSMVARMNLCSIYNYATNPAQLRNELRHHQWNRIARICRALRSKHGGILETEDGRWIVR